MKVLIIGNGGREHALMWKMRQCKKAQAHYQRERSQEIEIVEGKGKECVIFFLYPLFKKW